MKQSTPSPSPGTVRTILVLISSFCHPYVEDMVKGIQVGVSERSGCVVFLAGGSLSNPYRDHLANNQIFTLARSRRVDGVIAVSSVLKQYISASKYASFLDMFRGTPLVSIGEPVAGVPSLLIDNYQGMFDLVTHVIKKHGRRRLALLRGPAHNNDARVRFTAYRHALERHHLPFDPRLVASGPYYVDSGRWVVAELLDRRRAHFDALLCSNDTTAIAALEDLKRRGYRVPGDFIVTGFDDMDECRHVQPCLTTVAQPCFEAGQRAVRRLYDLMDGREGRPSPALSCRLQLRESCGCAMPAEENGTAEGTGNASFLPAASFPDVLVSPAMFDMSLHMYNERLANISRRGDLRKLIQETMQRFSVQSCQVFTGGNKRQSVPFDGCRLLTAYPSPPSNLDHRDSTLRDDQIPLCTDFNRQEATSIILPLRSRDDRLGFIRFGADAETFVRETAYGKNFGLVCELLAAGLGAAVHALDGEPGRARPRSGATPAGRSRRHETGFLSEAKIREIYKTLVTYMEHAKPYFDERLTLHRLSDDLHIPRNYLSAAVRRFCGTNFYGFIFRYRVREARKLMSKQPRQPMSIIDVAYQCGFRSKSTFNKVFKDRTGMTPSTYLERTANG